MKYLAAIVLFLMTVLSASAAPTEKRIALVIGNSSYTNIPALPNPKNDAELMAATLKDVGFTVISAIDVDYQGMRRAVKKFGQKLRSSGKDTVGLFYYAGHGVQARGANYLIPLGAEIDTQSDLNLEALEAADILDQMEDAGNSLNIVILDACRNNPYKGSVRSSNGGLARLNAASGSLIAFAAAPGQVAADGTGANSPYTEALVEAIRQPGLSVEQVFKRTRVNVEEKTSKRQTPWEESSLKGDFYFIPAAIISVEITEKKSSQPLAPSSSSSEAERAFNLIKDSRNVRILEIFAARFKGTFYADLAGERIIELKKVKTALVIPPKPVIKPKTSPVKLAVGLYFNPGDTFRDCAVCPEMVVIPAGSFMMGSPRSEKERRKNEGPLHKVTIPSKFAVGKFEVTFEEWDACVAAGGCNGYRPKSKSWIRGRRPVTYVSWKNARTYVKWLSTKTGASYRFLSESEWEYAARASTTTPYSTGQRITAKQANFYDVFLRKGEYRKKTVSVGSFSANAFGVYDLHGNVWEWVEDCWNDTYKGAPTNGTAWTSGNCSKRILRGGSWYDNSGYLRSAIRLGDSAGNRDIDSGFRVARTLAVD